MRYFIINWVHSEDGYGADLPDDCSYICLAGSARTSTFGLFGTSDELPDGCDSLIEVSRSLSVLLDSARHFPPALAFAQEEINRQEPMSREEFQAEMERRLRDHLEQQKSCRYCLIRSAITHTGYRSEGEFVWVVGYRAETPGREVLWVSWAYQIYADPVETFVVEPSWLASRFAERHG